MCSFSYLCGSVYLLKSPSSGALDLDSFSQDVLVPEKVAKKPDIGGRI